MSESVSAAENAALLDTRDVHLSTPLRAPKLVRSLQQTSTKSHSTFSSFLRSPRLHRLRTRLGLVQGRRAERQQGWRIDAAECRPVRGSQAAVGKHADGSVARSSNFKSKADHCTIMPCVAKITAAAHLPVQDQPSLPHPPRQFDLTAVLRHC